MSSRVHGTTLLLSGFVHMEALGGFLLFVNSKMAGIAEGAWLISVLSCLFYIL